MHLYRECGFYLQHQSFYTGAIAISKALMGAKELSVLYFYRNNFGDKGG
jgi:hypothetical protein